MTPPVGVDEARVLARGIGAARVPRHVPVSLRRAHGRVVAVDVRAAGPVPAADVSAMDGWAVAGEGPWRLLPGDTRTVERLTTGQAVLVTTGMPVPRGADRVLRRERGEVEEGLLRSTVAAPEPGADVRRRGEEVAAGDVVLERGRTLSPLALGAVAAAGVDAVHVVVPPRTALLVTGDELLDDGPSRPGRTRDSLSHVLPDLLVALGGDLGADLERTSRCGDDPAALRDVFAGPYRSTLDVVVTTGGTARGHDDHVRRALDEVRARVVVDGLAVRPGSPALLATVPDGPVVVALPGNPNAAVAATLLLLAPLLAGWLGTPDVAWPAVRLVGSPGSDVSHHDRGRPRMVPAVLDVTRGTAQPVPHAGPAMLRGLARADGYALVAPDGTARWVPLPV